MRTEILHIDPASFGNIYFKDPEHRIGHHPTGPTYSWERTDVYLKEEVYYIDGLRHCVWVPWELKGRFHWVIQSRFLLARVDED